MKSPTMPGQNSSGEKAAMRVIVAAMTGPAIRLAASSNACSRGMPSDMRRSANSVTMIASSTSMPTAKMSENSTTILIVKPISVRARMPIRNDEGMARPISIEARPDSAYKMTMKTRITAIMTWFWRSLRSCLTKTDLSCV